MEIDLDQSKAARLEAQKDVPTVKFGGTVFELPRELPFELVEELTGVADLGGELAQVKLVRVMTRAILGDREKEFLALKPSLADIQALINEVYPIYGLSMGE